MSKKPEEITVVCTILVTEDRDGQAYVAVVNPDENVDDVIRTSRQETAEEYNNCVGNIPIGHRYITHIYRLPLPVSRGSIVETTLAEVEDEPVISFER